jgi:hypothetical protein
MPRPRLTFFCELETEPLQALLDEGLIADLVDLQANLSLGILDLSPERAAVVQRLNQAGIPVIAWLLLPKEQGYWFNLYNASQAAMRYEEFRTWTGEFNLQWAGIGLDIEPDINELAELSKRHWRVLSKVFQRVFRRRYYKHARAAYQALVASIRANGYPVESYQFSMIADERKAGSTLLQRLAGLVDISVDKEVWMLYTSLIRPHGVGLLASYAPEAQAIGLGSTGGGVEMGISIPPLSWEELARDLRLAWYWCDDLYLFSLEGCVHQGFLKQLKSFGWDYPILLPEESQARIEGWRATLRSLLWLSANAVKLMVIVGGMVLLGRCVSLYFKRRSTHKLPQ